MYILSFFFIKHFFELRVFRILITKQSESLSIQGIVKSIENYYIYIQINVRFIIIRVSFFWGGKGRRIVYFSISLFYYLEKIFKMATLFVLDRYGCDYSSDIS